jgi:hypothetical protein
LRSVGGCAVRVACPGGRRPVFLGTKEEVRRTGPAAAGARAFGDGDQRTGEMVPLKRWGATVAIRLSGPRARFGGLDLYSGRPAHRLRRLVVNSAGGNHAITFPLRYGRPAGPRT